MTFDYDDLPDIAGMKTLTGQENLHIPTFGWTPIYQDDTGDLVLYRKNKFAFITSDKLEEYTITTIPDTDLHDLAEELNDSYHEWRTKFDICWWDKKNKRPIKKAIWYRH